MREAKGSVGFAALALALALASVILALASGRLPPPESPDAAASSFSAMRALGHVAQLAGEPRPTGSAAHAAAGNYLTAQLERLGLEVEVQEVTWMRRFEGGRHVGARVRNVLARRPGTRIDGPTLLLMAHYDSQPQTYGAGDDAAGAAVVLETLRALEAGPGPRNEILVAFTDAEELGLIGAEAFAADHPWFARVDRTLNFEGRGRRGPATMFETAAGGLEGVRDLARHAPLPAASSTSYEVYRRMPNDTDFSVVRRAQGHGLNFAFIGGLAAYHSKLDTAERLDPATLQHMGGNALALTRYYGAADLAPVVPAEGVYFNPLGLRPLWVFSAATARAAAALTLALALIAAIAAWRRGDLAASGLPAGLGLMLAAGGGAMVLAWGAWSILGWRAPATPYGLPYAEGTVAVAIALLSTASWLFCQSWWRRSAWELLAVLAFVWAALGAAVAWWLLGASHLFVLPAFFLALGTILGAKRRQLWWPVVVAVPAGLLLWTPILQTGHQALTMHAAAGLGLLSLLPATLLAPVAAGMARRWQRRTALVALGLGVALLAWAIHGGRPSSEHPRVDSLFAYHDRESGRTTWRTLDTVVDVWTAQALGAEPVMEALPTVLDPEQSEVLTAAATLETPAETLSVVRERDERPGGGRHLAIRLRSTAASLRLWAHAEVALTSATLDGRPCEIEADGEVRLSLHGRAAEGFLLELQLADRWPVQLEVVEVFYGLPATVPPRPDHLIPTPGWWTDTTMVKASFTL